MQYFRSILILFILFFTACESQEANNNILAYAANAYALKNLNTKKLAPKVGEWLYNNPDEMGQSLKAYIASQPYKATDTNDVLYLVKIGTFDSTASTIFQTIKDYLAIYFQIKTDTISTISLNQIPKQFTRIHQNNFQLQTPYLLDSLLYLIKPKNAFAVIGFATDDLYPDDNWNFVFGQASLRKGVGVWSMARFGDYSESKKSYQSVLKRSLKIASHETAHLLSMPHCVKYNCNINGSNSLVESDRQPEWLCWECLAKICFNRKTVAQNHIVPLLAFHQLHKLDTAAINYYQKANTILQQLK